MEYKDKPESASEKKELGQDPEAVKAAQDLDIRMGVMLGYSVGYVYLQIVSLVYIILFTISLLSKNKGAKFGKFFILYWSSVFFIRSALDFRSKKDTGRFISLTRYSDIMFMLSLNPSLLMTISTIVLER